MAEQKRHEETRSPRERLTRKWALIRRGLNYWKGSLVVLLVASAAALAVAWNVKHVYRSEGTVFAKPRIRTDDRDESSTSADSVARQAARMKDMLTTRGRLESAIKTFGLYPDTVAKKTMLDAVEEMKPHVGFRSLEGAQYVISFDGDNPDTVQKVTQYLSESLIKDYSSGDQDDFQRDADFLIDEERRSLAGLEDATKALTVFLAEHPEFAMEAKQAAATPFGPSPAAGIPLMPKAVNANGGPVADPELSALYRERARLDGQARNATSGSRSAVPVATSTKQIDEQIALSVAEVEAAAKRVAETQADLASKSNLTEDHPDMRASRMSSDAAARQLHEAKVKLAALQQMKANGLTAPPVDPTQVPPDIADKQRQIEMQIVARRMQVARAYASPAASSAQAQGARVDQATGTPPPMSPGVNAVVELETDWQRLLRALNEAKSHHDDLKLRAERAKLAFGASRAQAAQRMAIVDPPFRPTHPSKGGRTNYAIGGLAMAFLLAIAYASARASMDDRLIDAEDVEALGLGPVLGVVPRLKLVTTTAKRPVAQIEEASDDAAQ